MGSFEIVEHTADVGIRAWGETVEELFEQAARGLLDITGALQPGGGGSRDIELEARDLGALLVDWLDEIVYLQDANDAVITDLKVISIEGASLRASVSTSARAVELEGTAVKAVTYHQLEVEETPEGWTATVYVDV